ncbi:MAG: thioredoxin family protein [candidate division SR1 bacterium]|nr:thioredoxin family protein [candidate division SR1 bacterium]
MIIKILGTGCAKCKLLQKTVEDAVKKLNIDCEIIKVDDMDEILEYDIMATPGLVIDEQVVFVGNVPEEKVMMELLTQYATTKSCGGGSCDNDDDDCCGHCSCH